MMRTWGAYVHYLLRALGRLPNVACDVFRGYPDRPPFRAPSMREYSERPSQSSLSSGARESPSGGRMSAPL